MERRTISYKDKSKRRRKSSKAAASLESPSPVDEEAGETPSPANNNTKFKKSFHKMAKMVKLSRSISGGDKHPVEEVDRGTTTIPEVPEEEEKAAEEASTSIEVSNSTKPLTLQSQAGDESEPKPLPRKKRPPPRPSVITLKDSQLVLDNPTVTLTPSTEASPHNTVFRNEGEGPSSEPQQPDRRTKPHPRQLQWNDEDEGATKSRHSPHRLTSKLRFRPPPQTSPREEGEDNFFVINYIHMCVCGLWLGVANNGGNVMAFDFCTGPAKQQKQAGVSGSVW